ncbi:MAG: MATE family efflux transporter [Spirochaetes bacterium]|nr:MATE family efflux transporter [Spirochaetota bacterium]
MIRNLIQKNTELRKKIFVISIPIMIQMIVEYLLNLTDTAFIGHYDIKGVTAITNAIYPLFIFMSLMFATSKGTTILISQCIGAKSFKEARRYAEVSFVFNQIISCVYFIIWFIFGKSIIHLLGARGDILEMSYNYVRIISFHFLVLGFVLSGNSVLEGKGITSPIMVSSIVKTLLNIFLDWVFIFGKFGFPEMGIEGAAIATLISHLVSDVILLISVFLIKKDFILRLRGIFSPSFKIYFKSFKLGIPVGLDFMLWVLGQNALVFILNKYDPLAAGLFGIFGIILSLTVNLYMGISVAALNLVGKATGANDKKEAYRAGNLSIFYSLIICVIISFLFVLFPKEILSIFTNDKTIIDQYYKLLYIMAITTFPTALNVVGGNAIRGRGDTMWMLITQIPGTILLVFFSYIFMFVFNFGIAGLLIGIFLDELWRGVANYFKFALYYIRPIKDIQKRADI